MADYANANNAQNVSTTRGVVGGYFFSAPIGTVDIPTAANFTTWVPTDAWLNQGYIPEDGFTETVDFGDTTELRDINLDVVDADAGAATETLQIGLMEVNARALATIYGDSNVTDANGVITAEHDWGNAGGAHMFALLLLLKNGRKWVKLIRNGKVTAVGDMTGNKTTAAQRTVTITYTKDSAGNAGCVDYIESNDTPAPQLSTLSASGFTLSPTFAATTRTYTGTTTGTTVTITATAAAGNTVAIKCGANTYSSGNAIPVVTGTNIIYVDVTNTASGAVGRYTITVTK